MVKKLCIFIAMAVLFSCVKKGSVDMPEEKQASNERREAGENIPADTDSDEDMAMFPVWETGDQQGQEELREEEYVYTPLDDADVYTATVTRDGVSLRTMPGVVADFRSDEIKTLSAGDRVAILHRSAKKYTASLDNVIADYWYKVLAEDGESGYVFGGYLAGIDERRYGAVMDELKKRTEKLGPLFDDFGQSLVYLDIASLEKTKDWPLEIRLMVLRLHLVDYSRKELPDLSVFPSVQNLGVTMPLLEDISTLRDSGTIKYVYLNNTAISDAGVLSTCVNLEEISLANTKITGIPDLSRLKNLRWLYLDSTPIKSLRGIETLPRWGLNLSVENCDLLEDLDPLLDRLSASQIVFDEKNYERLRPWYDRNLSKIEASPNPYVFRFDLYFIE
jgi:hypothetical protein